MTKTLLTDIETAQLLGCGRSTLWRWVKVGTIAAPLKIGGITRWKLEDVEAVIAKAETARKAS
ncbi:helix-turn-helix transcriptional regulator [Profundibacter sp.]